MSTSVLERVGVPDDDGDSYTRVGISAAEVHANAGEPQPFRELSDRAKAMGYLAAGEHLPDYSPKPRSAGAPRAIGASAMTLTQHYK